MRKSSQRKVVVMGMILVMIMSVLFTGPVITVSAANTTYYVDSVGGNDGNNGTSTGTAWKSLAKVNGTTFSPGDKVLFKAGCVWSGQLYPLGSGTGSSFITIDMYGTGNKPVINGGGTVSDTVKLVNQQYWSINNLEITNAASTAAYRKGVHITASDFGTCSGIYLKNLYVHDVTGDINDKMTGGIGFESRGTVTSTKFNDVKIEGCTVYNVDRSGIFFTSFWSTRGGISGNGPWDGSTNVVIQNNVVNNIGGDGITTRVCAAPLVQYNVAIDCNKRAGTFSSNVAMWPVNCDDALFQYNEAYLTRYTMDGEGFDCDWNCNRTTFQYNYSHDNEGGFMLICCDAGSPGSFNEGSVVRYNISQNDKGRIIRTTGNPNNSAIYNNTFYVPSSYTTKIVSNEDWNGGYASNTYYYNNIIYNLGSGGYVFGASTNNVFDYNVFYGNHPSSEPADAHKITADPKLANPGSGGTGMNTVDGYKLLAASPCIDTGKVIASNGGKDYWGTALYKGLPDIGAHEWSSTADASVFLDDFQSHSTSDTKLPATIWSTVSDAAGTPNGGTIRAVLDGAGPNQYGEITATSNGSAKVAPYINSQPVNVSGKTVIAAKMRVDYNTSSYQNNISLRDNTGKFLTLLRFAGGTGNTLEILPDAQTHVTVSGAFEKNQWYDIKLVLDTENRKLDVYKDGVLIAAQVDVQAYDGGTAATKPIGDFGWNLPVSLRFTLSNNWLSGTEKMNLDNVNVYRTAYILGDDFQGYGTTASKLPTSIWSTVSDSPGTPNGGTIKAVLDGSGPNQYGELTATSDSSVKIAPYINSQSITVAGKTEINAKIKVDYTTSNYQNNISLRDNSGKFLTLLRFAGGTSNTLEVLPDAQTHVTAAGTFVKNQWYTVKLVLDTENRKLDVYKDGVCIASQVDIQSYDGGTSATKPISDFNWSVPVSLRITLSNSWQNGIEKMQLDNVSIYKVIR